MCMKLSVRFSTATRLKGCKYSKEKNYLSVLKNRTRPIYSLQNIPNIPYVHFYWNFLVLYKKERENLKMYILIRKKNYFSLKLKGEKHCLAHRRREQILKPYKLNKKLNCQIAQPLSSASIGCEGSFYHLCYV